MNTAPIVILINGSINSGKTTVSKTLKQLLPQTAHIEVDDLRAFIDWMPLEQSIPINLNNAVTVGKEFLTNNLNIIVSYPLGTKEHSFLFNQFSNHPVLTVTLRPTLDKALTNRGERELTEKETARIKHHYATGISNPDYESMVIDNSNESPEETAQKIIDANKEIQDNLSIEIQGYCAPSIK